MKKIILFTAINLFSSVAFAQLSIQGVVLDSISNIPLSDATIEIKQHNSIVIADSKGLFALSNLDTGLYTLEVRYLGFESLITNIHLTKSINITFRMVPGIVQTNEVAIISTRFSSSQFVASSMISKTEIEHNDFGKDIASLLESTPSLISSSDAGAGIGYTSIRLRGSDASRINFTINGVPLNDAESHLVYWVDLPDIVSSTDNILIQRGIATSSVGAGSFGGSVNLETNKIVTKPFAAFSSTYGSFNTVKYNASAGTGLINDHFSVDARVSHIQSDGYIDRATSDLDSYMINAMYLRKRSSLKAMILSGHEITYQAWNGVPQNLLQQNPTYNPFTYKNQVDNYLQSHYHLAYSFIPDHFSSLNLTGHYTKGKGYYEEYKNDQTLHDYGISDVVIGIDTIGQSDLIRRKWLDNDFVGLIFTYNNTRREKLKYSIGGAINAYIGNHYGEVIWARLASGSEIEHEYYNTDGLKTDASVYMKVDYKVHPSSAVFIDLQYRNVSYEYERNFDAVGLDNKKHQLNFINPKIGIWYSWNINGKTSLFMGVGNKEPNRADYVDASPGIVPVSEKMLDVECLTQYSKHGFNLDVNLFHMQYRDQLVLNGKVNDVGNYIRENIKDSYRQGLELSATWDVTKSFSMMTTCTFMKSNISSYTAYVDDYDSGVQRKENFTNTKISFTPDLIAGIQLSFSGIKNLTTTILQKYVGEQFLDNTENSGRMLDAYKLTDIVIQYIFRADKKEKITAGFALYNVLNERYENNGYTFSYIYGQEYTTENYYFPQAGRHFMIQCKVKI